MTNHELLRLILAMYGDKRHGMPHHQALEVADRALAGAGEVLTADDALTRYDSAFKDAFG